MYVCYGCLVVFCFVCLIMPLVFLVSLLLLRVSRRWGLNTLFLYNFAEPESDLVPNGYLVMLLTGSF